MSSAAGLRRTLDPALIAASKVVISLFILGSGFRAISDDDYSRVVIAQRFAEAPSLDPTGTSWLPFPFYVYGSALALLGGSLEAARAMAVVLGAGASVALWFAARLLGLSRAGALIAALLASGFPYSAYLGASTVPEAPAAALTVLGAATLAAGANARLVGGTALLIASGSRYEAWGAAFAFAALTGLEARRSRDVRLFGAAALALIFPAAWLLHGVVRHGDAFFFVTRVATYRAALGPDSPLLERLFRAPSALISREPELMLGFLLLALPALLRSSDSNRGVWKRPALALGAPLCLLIVGDLRGAAPTHHGERALLARWFGAALALGACVQSLARRVPPRPLLAAKLLLVLAAGVTLRAVSPRLPFVDRRSAEEIGQRARARAVQHLAIATPDYAYFAIEAAYAQPSRAWVIDDHDPRKPRAADFFADDASGWHERLLARQADGLILPQTRSALARERLRASEENRDYALFDTSRR